MAATLRHQASLSGSGSGHSPTSSASSQNTTPTSPQFLHAQAAVPRYASTHPYATAFSHEARSTTSLSIQHPRPPTPPLLHPPAHYSSFSSYLRSWGNSEVAAFLALHRCGHYASIFQRNDIDGRVLLDLDMGNLKEMGVIKVGERVKLLGGIKDLRKRAAASPASSSLSIGSYGAGNSHRIELRLNGATTPDPDLLGPRSPDIRLPGERAIAQPYENSRRLNSSRPPPLDLQPHHPSRPLPQAYQQNVPQAIISPPIQSVRQSLTPRPRISQTTSSSTTVTLANSVPGPSKSNSNLRAPPPRDLRRSPSPVNSDAASFADRPLPPPPSGHQREPSSAAEYATSITLQRNASDGRPEQRGLPSNPASTANRSNPINAVKGEHRKQPSLGTTPTKQISPIKAKFNQLVGGRPNTSGGPTHPFAVNASRDEKPLLSASSTASSTHKRQPTGGYVVGSGAMLTSKSSSSDTRSRKDLAANQAQLPLEDIRRQVVKFTNYEDMSTRTVNVSACTSGVEVLERVLKKFARWHLLDHSKIDEESDDEGDRLEIDGWGLYAESDPEDDGELAVYTSIRAHVRCPAIRS